jgi:hypothetical protein
VVLKMVVYGDAQWGEQAGPLLRRLLATVNNLLHSEPSLDALRSLVIQAGELEQAAADLPPRTIAEHVPALLASVTDAAAAAFESARRGPAETCSEDPRLRCAARVLEELPGLATGLSVKIPEGFAHYALYPEQYAVAAERWAEQHPPCPSGEVLVVGLRSIGTTLSAVVGVTLRAAGWRVRRLTVRPGGHPWEREVLLRPEEVGAPEWALVVDEGPGLSGSSMAAAAEALRNAGVDAARIVFFPGHGGEPGSAASESVRAWWAGVSRVVVSRDELRWDGRSLPHALAALVPTLAPEAGPVVAIEDLAGGQWRRVNYSSEARWPAVCAAFERPKYHCVTRDGRAFLWKYHGLSSTGEALDSAGLARQQLAERAASGWTLPPLGVAFGFVLTEWSEGVPLTRADRSPELLAHLGRYMSAVAGPELSAPETEAAWGRLRECLYWNTWEALGEAAAARASVWTDRAAALRPTHPVQRYGDGRLAPEHWLRTPAHGWLKTSATGHDADHTLVGRQPLAWDVAGALVEWGVAPEEAGPLLQAVPEDAWSIPELLTFYRMAYAAFRMGQCTLGATQTGDPAEQERLRHRAAAYRETLAGLLEA